MLTKIRTYQTLIRRERAALDSLRSLHRYFLRNAEQLDDQQRETFRHRITATLASYNTARAARVSFAF